MTRQEAVLRLRELRVQALLRAAMATENVDVSKHPDVEALGQGEAAIERVTALEHEVAGLRKLLRDIARDMETLQKAIYGNARAAQ